MRQIFGFSLTTTGLNGANLIILQLDALVIARFLPVAMITHFSIAGSLTGYARQVVSSISQTITPRVSALEGAGHAQRVRDVPLAAARVATLVVLPIIATFMIRGPSFISLWMDPQYGESSGEVLRILSIALALAAARQVMSSAMIGLNRHILLVPVHLLEAGLNLALSLALVRSMGIAGVAWGTTGPSVLITAFVLPRIYAKAMGFPVTRFWTEAWLRPALAAVPFALATFAVEHFFPARSLVSFFLEVFALMPIWALGAWLVGLDADERQGLRSGLPTRLRPAPRARDGHERRK